MDIILSNINIHRLASDRRFRYQTAFGIRYRCLGMVQFFVHVILKYVFEIISLNKYVVRFIINQANYCASYNIIVEFFVSFTLVCNLRIVPLIEKILFEAHSISSGTTPFIKKFVVSSIIRSLKISRDSFQFSSFSFKVLFFGSHS